MNARWPKTGESLAPRIDWADLEVFVHVARCGTLASAARALGVNASTVQRRIGRLEESLSTRLFHRRQQGYSVTAAGEALVAHAETIEQQVLAASRALGGHDQALSGTVRVATVDDLATGVLPPILGDFRAKHPQVTLVLSIDTGFADLSRRQADVAIRFGRPPTDPDVVGRRVCSPDVALYASRAYLRRHPAPTRPEDLADHSVVVGDEQMAGVGMERFMSRWADPSKIAVRSNSMLMRLGALRAGLGVGFAAVFMARDDRSLQRVPIEFEDSATEIWMLVHVDMKRNARVRAFAEFVHRQLLDRREMFQLG